MEKQTPIGLQIGWKLAGLRKKDKNNCTCTFCGTVFYRRGIRKELSKNGPFCSVKCKSQFQRGTSSARKGMRSGKKKRCKTCGVIFYCYPSTLKKGGGKYCSNKCRTSDKSQYPSGNNHYAWKGGYSEHRKKIRHHPLMSEWKRAVLERDNFQCQHCGKRGKGLIAHHIKPFAEYPRLRLKKSNGITLCKSCHIKEHENK